MYITKKYRISRMEPCGIRAITDTYAYDWSFKTTAKIYRGFIDSFV